MGASGWSYFTKYQADINVALQEIRQQVFESGNYYKQDHSEWRNIEEEEMRQQLEGTEPEIYDIMLEEWRKVKKLQEPDSIERLLEWNQEAGTHSILDIYKGVSTEPDFGTVSPLTNQQLLQIFGTMRPTHELIADWLQTDGLSQVRRRWRGVYFLVYENETPTEICFAGFSGD